MLVFFPTDLNMNRWEEMAFRTMLFTKLCSKLAECVFVCTARS